MYGQRKMFDNGFSLRIRPPYAEKKIRNESDNVWMVNPDIFESDDVARWWIRKEKVADSKISGYVGTGPYVSLLRSCALLSLKNSTEQAKFVKNSL